MRNPTIQDLYSAAEAAEKRFIAAYTADPNRRGMRPGDFRYQSRLHSALTRVTGEQLTAAMDAWREAFRATNAA